MELRARTTLPAGVNTPAAARAFVRDAVEDAAVPVEDLTLVVSELVTNAVISGSEAIELAVVVEDERILVEVAEESPAGATPAAVVPFVEDLGDRGLMLVARLSQRWGVRRDGERKVLWADLVAS